MSKKTTSKKTLEPLPEIPNDELESMEMEDNQTLNQKKIALAQSGASAVIIELVKDVLQQVPIVGNNEWETIRNAIIIDTSSTLLRDLIDHLENIKSGSLIGKK